MPWEVIRLPRSPAREWLGQIPQQTQNPRGSQAQFPQPMGRPLLSPTASTPGPPPPHPTAEQSCGCTHTPASDRSCPTEAGGGLLRDSAGRPRCSVLAGTAVPKGMSTRASGCDPGNRASAEVITAHRVVVRSRRTTVGPASEDKVLIRDKRTRRHRKKPSEHGEQTGDCGHKPATPGAPGCWEQQGGPSPQPPERRGPARPVLDTGLQA